MTLHEALAQHQLDVAALEIGNPTGQSDNLKKWMAMVDPSEQADARFMARTFEKVAVEKKRLSASESANYRRIMQKAECGCGGKV
jgi:hypothetical protein